MNIFKVDLLPQDIICTPINLLGILGYCPIYKFRLACFGKSSTWFVAELVSSCIPVQDIIHEGAKLRTRVLKSLPQSKLIMPFGDKTATPSYIISLMDFVTKDQHGLREGDIFLEDKMNYDAVLRICRPEVQALLTKHVIGSEGTCFYLKLIHVPPPAFDGEVLMYNKATAYELGIFLGNILESTSDITAKCITLKPNPFKPVDLKLKWEILDQSREK
ncbi:hypothetical protein OUZ56_018671 [Daphnia magna]|uniref:Uncharacterized protein n=1 Tax=Daphnia magna TaxID=35525 RepID=A0ABQ9Z9H5_9CRUS|nr:hypothetical protein OUZ56_018671 [Daphnia magna]